MADPKVTSLHNRKPADELADVRERIRVLKTREEALREQMIAGKCDLIGDEYKVVISKTKSEVIDTALMKKELGTRFLQQFMKKREITFVRLQDLKGGDHGEEE